MRTALVLTLILGLSASVFAHEGVKDPQVRARMDLMKTLAGDEKLIRRMARGEETMDLVAARAAAVRIVQNGHRVTDLFENRSSDPKSEAKPDIWTDWAAFSNANARMVEAATILTSVQGTADLGTGARHLAETCSACHDRFSD
ncbi:MAG: cytochrome c [Pseudomonadota bacterium]